MPDRTDATREMARKLRKGRKPQEIIQELQDDFLAQGLDAYEQFKRLNVGIDHDEHGEPQRRIVEGGQEIKEPLLDPGAPARGGVDGVFALPDWRGDRTDRPGGLVDTSESATYLARKDGERKRKLGEAHGPSLATLVHHVGSQEPMPHKQPSGPGDDGGGGPDGGPGGGAGSPSALQGEGGDGEGGIRAVLRRARDPDGEDAFFQPQRYQRFSREPIIFYKRVVNDAKMLRWTIKAGEAFKRRTNKAIKYFIPITLLGQVLGSYQIVFYRVNLELIKIPDSITQQLENCPFETIWPFILYLFNYWVKNQASLMMKSGDHPQSAIYATELKRINQQQRFIEFFHETAEFQEELRRKARLESIEATMLGEGGAGAKGGAQGQELYGEEGGVGGEADMAQYDDLHDFSSEIEYDERFDAEREKFKEQFQVVGNVTEGQRRIEKSVPDDRRANTKQQRVQNRKQLLEAYKKSVAEREMEKKRVKFEQAVIAADNEKDPEKAERERKQEREVRRRVEAEKYMVNIQDFINENYLYLPANTTDSKYRLLAALQSRDYHEQHKKEGLAAKAVARLNEERRRRRRLPPLPAIDYNAIERAAQKLKLIIDCLMLTRRMSGHSLIAKDIVVTQMLK